MKKLTVKDASHYLGITREAIYNRIRRGSLQSVTENDIKYVLIQEVPQNRAQAQVVKDNAKYEEYLKTQVEDLKNELKEAKQKIERLYQEKDEQLKSLLQIALQAQKTQAISAKPQESVIEAKIKQKKEWIALVKLLKRMGFEKSKRVKIRSKLERKIDSSKHLKQKNGKIYVNKYKKFKEIYGE